MPMIEPTETICTIYLLAFPCQFLYLISAAITHYFCISIKGWLEMSHVLAPIVPGLVLKKQLVRLLRLHIILGGI